MIADLKPYPAMKNSGVPWLGKVPVDWEVLPLCVIARIKSVTGKVDRELLSVYLDRGVIRFSEVEEKRTNVTSEDLSKYQAVDPGDFVLNNQQAWRGSVGVSQHVGIVSPAYLVLSLDTRIDPAYANLLFREKTMVDQYLICSRGVGTIQRNLYWPSLKRVFILLPPVPEQAAIAQFVDHADRRIRRYIRAKQKLLELLLEKKQAIIQQIISSGRHAKCWSCPLRAVMRPVKRVGFPNKTLLSLFRDFGVIRKDSRENKNVDVRDLALCQLVEPGDIVINKMKAWQGSVAVSDLEGIVSPDYMVLKFVSDQFAPNFFHHLLRSPKMVAEYRRHAYGVRPGQWRLMYPELCGLRLIVPPLKEQAAIAQSIEVAVADIGKATMRVRREVELLREYRTRLIADMVTGNLDVRGAAARLPDEADEPEPLDDVEVLSEGYEETEDTALDAVTEEAEA